MRALSEDQLRMILEIHGHDGASEEDESLLVDHVLELWREQLVPTRKSVAPSKSLNCTPFTFCKCQKIENVTQHEDQMRKIAPFHLRIEQNAVFTKYGYFCQFQKRIFKKSSDEPHIKQVGNSMTKA